MSYTSGLDIIFSEPGEHESLDCPTCGTKMNVQRDCTGATGWAEATAHGGHPHDTFTCPHYAEKWHAQLVKLRQYKASLPSAALCALVEAEIAEIQWTRKPTL